MSQYQTHFTNVLITNTNKLFKLTYPNKKDIILDKKSDVFIEILNMLFKDINDIEQNTEIKTLFGVSFDKYHYYNKNNENKKITIKSNKKQLYTAKLMESIINTIINKLSDIVDENEELLISNNINRNKLEVGIDITFNNVIEFLNNVNNDQDIIWQQSIFNTVKIKITDEIARAQYKPSGVKGMGTCRRCDSEELYVITKTTTSCDEGQANEYTCLTCGNKWMIR